MRGSDPPVYHPVGTSKARLKRFEADFLGQPWENVPEGVNVKLQSQEGELYAFAQSRDRVAKERPMRVRANSAPAAPAEGSSNHEALL